MSTGPALSFDRAVYPGDAPPPDACAYCNRGLTEEYFRINGRMACQPCAQQADELVPRDTHKAYSRAFLFGIIAAIMGCIAYALFQIATGIGLGWAAIGVGWLIGWSMKKGSHGLGGRRYQITAALLTYAAVAVAFVPVALHQQSEQKKGVQQTEVQSTEAKDAQKAESKEPQKANGSLTFGGFLGACLMLLGIGLASPFLILQNSIPAGGLHLLIILIGVRYAWMNTKQTRPSIDGPFTTGAAV